MIRSIAWPAMSQTDPPKPAPDALPRAEVLAPDRVDDESDSGESVPDIESPAKIIRIGAMVKQMLEEVRSTSIDDAARDQLRRIYESSLEELKSSLSEDLGDELDALAFEFDDHTTPTEAELRMAQAQLVGWLEGLFHGIQATLVAQQMAARQQLEGMRAPLPEAMGGPGRPGPGPGYI